MTCFHYVFFISHRISHCTVRKCLMSKDNSQDSGTEYNCVCMYPVIVDNKCEFFFNKSPRVQKERKHAWSGKWECFQWKAHRQCFKKETHVVSGDRLLPHQNRWVRKTAKHQATERKALQTKGARFRVSYTNFQKPLCKFWLPPCVKNISLRLDPYMEEDGFSDMLMLRRSPAKSQRKMVRKDLLLY